MGNLFSKRSHKAVDKEADKKGLKSSKSKGRGDEVVSATQLPNSTNETTTEPVVNDEELVREALEEVDSVLAKESNEKVTPKDTSFDGDAQEAKEENDVKQELVEIKVHQSETNTDSDIQRNSKIQAEQKTSDLSTSGIVGINSQNTTVDQSNCDPENITSRPTTELIDDHPCDKPESNVNSQPTNILSTETSDQIVDNLGSKPDGLQNDERSDNEVSTDVTNKNEAVYVNKSESPAHEMANEQSNDLTDVSNFSVAGSIVEDQNCDKPEKCENIVLNELELAPTNLDPMNDLLMEKCVRSQDDNESTVSNAGSAIDTLVSCYTAPKDAVTDESFITIPESGTNNESHNENSTCGENDEQPHEPNLIFNESADNSVSSQKVENENLEEAVKQKNIIESDEFKSSNEPSELLQPKEESDVKENESSDLQQEDENQENESNIVSLEPEINIPGIDSLATETHEIEDVKETSAVITDAEKFCQSAESTENQDLGQESSVIKQAGEFVEQTLNELENQELSLTCSKQDVIDEESRPNSNLDDTCTKLLSEGEIADNLYIPGNEAPLTSNSEEKLVSEIVSVNPEVNENLLNDEALESQENDLKSESILPDNSEMHNSTTEVLPNCEESAMIDSPPSKLQLPIQDEMILDEPAEMPVNGKHINEGDVSDPVTKPLSNGDTHQPVELANGTLPEE